jgi:predicted amidophosphoribosyltransferase
LRGRSFILVDDVITTAAMAEACAKVLRRAGARSVDLIAFARVLR